MAKTTKTECTCPNCGTIRIMRGDRKDRWCRKCTYIKIGSKQRNISRSEETKKKISESLSKRIWTVEEREKVTNAARTKNKGNKYCLGKNVGEKNGRWISDRTLLKGNENPQDRRNPMYKAWRKNVCNRDNWKCRMSNDDCNGRLEVHHILSFTLYPELRYEINNGICLCHYHHPKNRKTEAELIPFFNEIINNLN